jgi:hypothetical protein
MSLLVPPETMLQRLVHDVLHARVRRRVDVNPSLQEIFYAEIRTMGFELLKDMLDDSRRLQRLALVAAHNLKRAPLRLRRRFQRQEPIRPHQRERLVSPA